MCCKYSLGTITWVVYFLLKIHFAWGLLECDSSCSQGQTLLVCPDYIDKQFKIEVQGETAIYLECTFNLHEIDYSLVQNCSFPYITKVMIKYCPFTNSTFEDLFNVLGINVAIVEHLSITYPSISHAELNSDHLRGLSNLEYLNLEKTKLTSISEEAFLSTPNLTTLHIRGNDLRIVGSRTFAPLKRLSLLNLSKNNLSSIPEGSFDELESLEFIYFWDNRLKTLPENIFHNLSNLKNISLLDNDLEFLNGEIFSQNFELQNLDMRRNSLQSLPNGIFNSNTKLDILKMSRNNISLLNKDMFESNNKIKTLDLSSNSLISFPEGIFNSLLNVEHIDLSRNKLESLPPALLSFSPELNTVILEKNQLIEIPDGLFQVTSKLKTLKLSENNLTGLPDRIFVHCHALKTLELSKNKLSQLTLSSFPTYKHSSLTDVDLSYNNLNSTNIMPLGSFALNHQLKLEELNLKFNKFKVFPASAGFYIFNHLKNINLEGNNITYLELSDISSLQNNTVVNLKNNQIDSVYSIDLALLSNSRTKVYLEGNPFKCDCLLFKFVRALKSYSFTVSSGPTSPPVKPTEYLVSKDTKSKYLLSLEFPDKSLLRCANPRQLENTILSELNVTDLTCPLKKEDCAPQCNCLSQPSESMIVVNCSSRDLKVVPSLQMSLKYNYSLNLDNNAISSFNLSSFRSLVRVSLRENMLSTDSIKGKNILPPFLESLDLYGNNLTFVPEALVEFLNRSKSVVILSNNPWVCDCKIKHLRDYMQYVRSRPNFDRRIHSFGEVRCTGLKKRLMSLTNEEICSVYLKPMVIVTISVIVGLLLLFALLGTVSFYHFKDIVKPFLWKYNICLWWIDEEELDEDKIYDAFISYSHNDEEFINDILVPGLENGDPKYRICLHYRDWLVGEAIQTQIMDSVRDSRRTLVILSKNFIESVWGQMEFRVAHQQALKDKTNRVIVIVYGEMPPKDSIDTELCHYIQMHTYLEYEPNARFWERLRYAMPHPKKKKHLEEKVEMSNGHVREV